jgi:hypothetical protein
MAMQIDSYSTNNIESLPPAAAPSPASIHNPPSAPKKSKKVVPSQWSFTPLCSLNFPLTLPPGTYYIGDLCYALDDKVYDKIFGDVGGYANGMYQKSLQEFFLVDSTAIGDGEYQGTDGKQYAVDAGIIGITPISCMLKSGDGGHVHTFHHKVSVDFKDGVFEFFSLDKYLTIDTLGTTQDDDDDHDDEEEDQEDQEEEHQ